MTPRLIVRAAALVALLFAVPTQAAWLKATSAHFIVYSNTSETALRKQATDLELFDTLVRRFHNTAENRDAPFNKVTVYVVPDFSAVQRLSRMRNVAGFYVPRVDGSVAFTPRSGGTDVGDLSPRIVLFHEYAHHFLLGNYAIAYPAWFSEGYAEFASTVMEKDGAYWIGAAANHRAYGLFNGRGLSSRQLFDPPARLNDEQTDALYGRGWLLTHLIMFDPAMRKQFATYIDLFNAGTPSLKAATQAFGDLDALDRRLDTYLKRKSLPALGVKRPALGDPRVDIRALTAGEAALIDYRIQSTRGVDGKTAPPLYAKAATAAARYRGDAVAQGWLAEMAFDAGLLDAAEAAADAALAADPVSSQALLYKARVHIVRAVAGPPKDAKVWAEARGWIVKANHASPDDAAALALFYESFTAQKTPPSKSAIAGLYRAIELVPQDAGLRFAAARQLIMDGRIDTARSMLRPLSADPHGGPDNAAARLLAILDSGQAGRAAIDALEKAGEKAADKDGDKGEPGKTPASG